MYHMSHFSHKLTLTVGKGLLMIRNKSQTVTSTSVLLSSHLPNN